MDSTNNTSKTFVVQITPEIGRKLLGGLQAQGFVISHPPYTEFSGKKEGISCTFYTTGKLVVQGKGMAEFIEFYLEPEVLGQFNYSYRSLAQDSTAHIGVDESGKGDFFGPLCIAAVYASEEQIEALTKHGVRDSKQMQDKVILALGKKIESEFPHAIVRIFPQKYNELYEKFKNLNHLLAWGHSTVIEQLVSKTGCKSVTIDQFAHERVVESALMRKGIKVDLTQRHRGEEDVVVAAASILARKAFVQGMEKLSEQFQTTLPKGASQQVIQAGKGLVQKFGAEVLGQVSKQHFQTTQKIIGGAP